MRVSLLAKIPERGQSGGQLGGQSGGQSGGQGEGNVSSLRGVIQACRTNIHSRFYPRHRPIQFLDNAIPPAVLGTPSSNQIKTVGLEKTQIYVCMYKS